MSKNTERTPPPIDDTIRAGIRKDFIRQILAERLLESDLLMEVSADTTSELEKISERELDLSCLIPPSFRTINDFSVGQTVVINQSSGTPHLGSWSTQRVTDIWPDASPPRIEAANSKTSPVRSLTRVNSLGLWPEADFNKLQSNYDSSKMNLARFVVNLETGLGADETEAANFIRYFARMYKEQQ